MARKRSRFTLQFEDCEEKLAGLRENIAYSKKATGETNNYDWLSKLIRFYKVHHDDTSPSRKQIDKVETSPASSSSAELSRKEIHTALDDDDGEYFITGKAATRSLVKCLTESKGCCPVCGGFLVLDSCQLARRGHCGRITISCNNKHETVWFSSANLQSKYVANLR